MKKITALLLALVMTLSMAACSSAPTTDATTGATTEAPTTEAAKPALTDSLDVVAGKISELNPVEFAGMTNVLDLADTSEDGQWMVTYNTGLTNADALTEAVVFEPMMSSVAFSLVLVRVADAANAQAVAEEMKNNIDTRKWICVEANELLVAGYGDVVMLIMLDNQTGMTAQSFVDAFRTVCGAELDFTI